jgi:hypothetical protein
VASYRRFRAEQKGRSILLMCGSTVLGLALLTGVQITHGQRAQTARWTTVSPGFDSQVLLNHKNGNFVDREFRGQTDLALWENRVTLSVVFVKVAARLSPGFDWDSLKVTITLTVPQQQHLKTFLQ